MQEIRHGRKGDFVWQEQRIVFLVMAAIYVAGALCSKDTSATPLPENISLAIEEEFDRINLGGHFNEGDYVVFVLTNENNDAFYYPLKTIKVNFTAMCVGSFQNEDLSFFQRFVNKDGLAAGTYTLGVFIKDTYYTTDITWKV